VEKKNGTGGSRRDTRNSERRLEEKRTFWEKGKESGRKRVIEKKLGKRKDRRIGRLDKSNIGKKLQ
jgi:hypothetical protein